MAKNSYSSFNKHNIDNNFYKFIDQEVVSGLKINADDFFNSICSIVEELKEENEGLLQERDNLQLKIDNWHVKNKDNFSFKDYKELLIDIGYLLPEPDDFAIDVGPVAEEIYNIAGPQLVVPVSNDRFLLNAVNARWGSLFDAFYGTDVIPNKGDMAKSSSLNLKRANKTVEIACDFLDQVVPLEGASYRQIKCVEENTNKLLFKLNNDKIVALADNEKYVGINKDGGILLRNNNLLIEVVLDQNASYHPSAISDVILESAITTIVDFEDSASTVSNDEKVRAYRNYLGLIKGNLKSNFVKNGKSLTRKLNNEKVYIDTNGKKDNLSGISTILVRHVGIHMTTDLIQDIDNKPIFEGVLDAMVTGLIASHYLKDIPKNAPSSMYVVKPKLHGPKEVAFTVKLFALVEKALGLNDKTIKIGIMDEERRTSVNLKACIKEAKDRVIFVNTGFLDRTGDEIHTSMLAGPMRRKENIKKEAWYSAYENNNVAIGLQSGFYKRAQIGKGMWAQPDQMREMLDTKKAHLEAGANCAWVPSPTAATLHATHYHYFDVFQRQQQIINDINVDRDSLLDIPLLKDTTKLSNEQIITEIENNAHSILGYVVRWIDQGIGCSKVQNIDHIGLMEDRATLRISSQHMANWLHHKVCSDQQVIAAFEKMARVVDEQNKSDENYKKMAPDYNGYAYLASLALVFEGKQQPNGYTIGILKKFRQKALAI
ncbi:MAG: malate synthase G [Gammaproteobacteria bacterium]|nr:malate synthase G [Gammaproteobacteria bacterium]